MVTKMSLETLFERAYDDDTADCDCGNIVRSVTFVRAIAFNADYSPEDCPELIVGVYCGAYAIATVNCSCGGCRAIDKVRRNFSYDINE